MQHMLHHIHGAAPVCPILLYHAVPHGEIAFGIAGGDPQHAGDPAPEHCPRPPDGHRGGDPDDISCSDGRGKGRGKGGKRRHITSPALPVFPGSIPLFPALVRPHDTEADSLGDLSLDDMQADRKINVCTQQDHKHGHAPQKPLQRLDGISNTGHELTFHEPIASMYMNLSAVICVFRLLIVFSEGFLRQWALRGNHPYRFPWPGPDPP